MANGKSSTIEIDQEVLSSLLRDVAVFSRAAETLRKNLERLLPHYGSKAWWEEGEKKVDAELRRGKSKTFANENDFLRYMKTLT